MGSRSRKAEVRELLAHRDRSSLVAWAAEARNPDRLLVSLTYDNSEVIRYRAVEAVGWVAGDVAQRSIEKIRDNLRRLLWLMNDESGGLSWHAPELMGEILVNVPELIGEFAHLLPAFFGEEPFERGSHLAVCRISSVDATPFRGVAMALRQSLRAADPNIRLSAALSLVRLEESFGTGVLEQLLDESTRVTTYDFDSGELVATNIGAAVRQELRAMVEPHPVERS